LTLETAKVADLNAKLANVTNNADRSSYMVALALAENAVTDLTALITADEATKEELEEAFNFRENEMAVVA
jgi:hypothetical protein